MKLLITALGSIMLVATTAVGDEPRTSVGLEGQMTATLPSGTKIGPQDARSEVLVQIVTSVPSDNGVRLTFRFWPMTPGDHDLRSTLMTVDDKPFTLAPPLMIHAVSSLPPDWKGQLDPVQPSAMSQYGGYHKFYIAVIAVWIVSLFPIFLLGRRQLSRSVPFQVQSPPSPEISLADLVAARSTLSPRDRHRLEMLLLQQWRLAHGLTEQPIDVALNRLRSLPQTAEPLKQLQTWLHAPAERSALVDTQRLLSLYAQEFRS